MKILRINGRQQPYVKREKYFHCLCIIETSSRRVASTLRFLHSVSDARLRRYVNFNSTALLPVYQLIHARYGRRIMLGGLSDMVIRDLVDLETRVTHSESSTIKRTGLQSRNRSNTITYYVQCLYTRFRCS